MIIQVRMKEELTTLISRYSDIFQNELGTIKAVTVGIIVKERATPRFLSMTGTICTPFKGRQACCFRNYYNSCI